jgi:hypothetical protein
MNAPVNEKPREEADCGEAIAVFRDFIRALEKLAAANAKRAARARRRRAQA